MNFFIRKIQRSLTYAKAVPESAMKVYFPMAERSLTYAKIAQKINIAFTFFIFYHQLVYLFTRQLVNFKPSTRQLQTTNSSTSLFPKLPFGAVKAGLSEHKSSPSIE